MSSQPTCPICLEDALSRGGEPITSPGCCGQWFHQRCINDAVASGNTNCPQCRATLPFQPPPNPSLQLHRNIFGFGSPFPRTFSLSSEDGNDVISNSQDIEDPITNAVTEQDINNNKGEFSIQCRPERRQAEKAEVREFFVSVEMKYESPTIISAASAVDVVCILDVSGSMNGNKLSYLKRAMQFVISSLSPSDRLAIVSFESASYTIQGLTRMTGENKTEATSRINSLEADGGTSIYHGLSRGWGILKNRKQRNQSSCVFLLTDGQDGTARNENLQLAREMKEAGTSLFTFGFGRDHDSALMTSIAEAAQGIFSYIETPDTVIDAFGGAIGSQQSQSLKQLELKVESTTPGVTITKIQAGIYSSKIKSGATEGTTTFANLFGGERRSVLLSLSLPRVDIAITAQPVISVVASYVNGTEDVRTSSERSVCCIDRVDDADLDTSVGRDLEVDAEIMRHFVTDRIKEALIIADRGDIGSARDLVVGALKYLRSSESFKSKLPVVLGLEHDLEEANKTLINRNEFRSRRALMSEGYNNSSAQRCVFSKGGGSSDIYQSPVSRTNQSFAAISKQKV